MPTAKPRVLLSSVFQPFTVDDELAQGPFSLRMHHRSWGIMLIQHNIQAPTTLLDFPSRERDLRRQMEREFGGLSSVINRVAGRALLWSARRESSRYPAGRPMEPQTFIDRTNWA